MESSENFEKDSLGAKTIFLFLKKLHEKHAKKCGKIGKTIKFQKLHFRLLFFI